MAKLFSDPTKRIVAIYGNTGDHFYTPQLRELDLSTWLWVHFKSLGYQRIAFYSPDKKLHFLDEQSAALARSDSAAPDHAAQATPCRSAASQLTGALGGARLPRQRLAARWPSQTQPDSVWWHYGSMTDAQAESVLDRMMREPVPTVLVFQNGEDVFTRLDEAAVRHWENRLRDWTGATIPADSRNLAVLIFRGEITIDGDRLPGLHKHLFGEGTSQQPLTDRSFRVGTAQSDEVDHLLQRLRLTGRLRWTARQITKQRDILARGLIPEKTGDGIKSMATLTHEVSTMTATEQTVIDQWEMLRQRPSLTRQVETKLRAVVDRAKERLARQGPPAEPRGPHDIDRLTVVKSTNPDDLANLHLALLGSPGTGKTTLARLVAGIYRQEGILATGHLVEVTAKDLIEEHIGGTAKRTAEAVGRALGGVLFIDEAYSLNDNDFGKEAVAELVKAMTDYNGQFAVIIAGYTDPIIEFIQGPGANPGLVRRFPDMNRWTLESYSPTELYAIFSQMLAQQGRAQDADLSAALPNAFTRWHRAQDPKRFGNAGEVRNLVDAAIQQAGARRTIVREDFAVLPGWGQYLGLQPVPELDDLLRPLDAMIGLTPVKDAVRALADTLAVQQHRGQIALVPGHYVFQGNPGTGKTTVARVMGSVFQSLGLLRRGHVVEVKRDDLVGRYQGDAETNTKEQIEKALDGVLFVDEAYQLAADERDTYGRRAFETLLTAMDNHRARLCVILAGYPAQMQQLLQTNPGFQSRVANSIDFPDYSAEELLAIALGQCSERKLLVTDAARAAVTAHLQGWDQRRDQAGFGNGRDVRNLVDAIVQRQAMRIRPLLRQLSLEESATIEPEDVPA